MTAQVSLITLTMSLFYLSVRVSHDRVSQYTQPQDPATEAAKWSPAIIHLIISSRAFPCVTCQNATLKRPVVNGQIYSNCQTDLHVQECVNVQRTD